ncbi:hypothetical protein [Cyclobacterium marinum]|uniref:Uncharacterized protein n=1 Tax=Cyclobacterium marinum (strain ATCC 25205 / DSM 745 / LMG 13164 / NCIMB 1802) TaxID=880070 RepID=G0J054_CYCMS|nr:hypothetical protein [Cyclobacterium marinum]AEL27315.1 hypothetical protein Cycma_3597 [Cyclobacterium marinum DSM 745]
MNNSENHINILLDKRDSRFKSYLTRRLIQIAWYLLLLGTPTLLLVKTNGLIALYILIPFIIFWLTWDYLEERRFKYTTLFLSLNSIKGELYSENIDIENREKVITVDLSKCTVILKELRLGQFYVPGYELLVKQGSKVVYRQKDSYVIARLEIKEIADKLIDYQVEKGRQIKPISLFEKIKIKMKTLANNG